MQYDILTQKGKETGEKIDLPEGIFGIEPNEHIVYLDVKRLRAAQRQGTHKAKEKGEVCASTRKVMRQKGTGNARKGSVKSGILRGGGRFHGPRPRAYILKVNKKEQRLARRSVLSQRAKEKKILVLQSIALEGAKTKAYKQMLADLNLADQKTLLILPSEDRVIMKASSNLPKAHVSTAQNVNTYQLLNTQKIVVLEASIPVLEKTLLKK